MGVFLEWRVREKEGERKQARRRVLEGVFNQDLVVHKLSGLSALTYRDLERHKIPRTATRDGGAPPPPPVRDRVRVGACPCPTPVAAPRVCVSVSSVGFVQYSQSRGEGSEHAFLPGPEAPDATTYTEDAPRREREREGKKKKKASHLRVCGFEFFVHAYAGGVGE